MFFHWLIPDSNQEGMCCNLTFCKWRIIIVPSTGMVNWNSWTSLLNVYFNVSFHWDNFSFFLNSLWLPPFFIFSFHPIISFYGYYLFFSFVLMCFFRRTIPRKSSKTFLYTKSLSKKKKKLLKALENRDSGIDLSNLV